MNFKKYIYVSPQNYSRGLKQWDYEYIRNGEFFRTRSFGYHEGKEIIRQLELDAWVHDQRIRMLNQFQWRDLRYTLLGGKYTDPDGNKIIFHSIAQFEKFRKELSSTDTKVKVLRQLPGGEIIIQHVYQDDEHLFGYLKIIGSRGGTKSEYGYSVAFDNGEPYLTKHLGQLFEYHTCQIEQKVVPLLLPIEPLRY